MNNTQRTSFDIQITANRLNTLRNYVATKPIELNRKKQEAIVDSLIFHLQKECTDIDRIIKNAKEYEKCYYLTEIEKGHHRRLCKALNQILFDFENELIALGTKRNINWESEIGFDFELEFPDQPINQLLENHLEIAKEFEEFIKIEKHSQKASKKQSLNSNFDDIGLQIDIIIKATEEIFISNKEQWTNLFSDDIKEFTKPIELKDKTTIADLRLFLDSLKHNDLIKKSSFNKIIEESKAFLFDGNLITANNLKHATGGNYPNTANSHIIKETFKSLNIED
jgi:hypothetical protein